MSEPQLPNVTLDATGLLCPLPVLKAQKALRALDVGDVLKVMTTDPNAPSDFQDLCRVAKYELLSSEQDGAVFMFWIRKMV